MKCAGFLACLLLAVPLASASISSFLDAIAISRNVPLWCPNLCTADKRIVKDRLYHTLHNWKDMKDTDAVICQIQTVNEAYQAPNSPVTPYNKCVDDLINEKFGNSDDYSEENKQKRPSLNRKLLKTVLDKEAEFMEDVVQCSKKLDHCCDVHHLRACMTRHNNPLYA